ncbi:hypothetical protein AAVH_16760 [Aphelenchoides avenae]|nr:hypothetical protein AAVH_16760 [Aphelenchus avenae]
MLTIALLNRENGLRDLYDYKALVFYAAKDGTEYCIRNGTRADVYSAMHHNVRFLVARYNRTVLTDATGETNVTSFVPRIQQAFSEIVSENQCDRLKKIEGKLNGALSEFNAVAVIKCARKFVWYELGYRYFQAAWTNSVDIPSEHESDYSSKCGRIVLFP